jgi:hypothetical protein
MGPCMCSDVGVAVVSTDGMSSSHGVIEWYIESWVANISTREDDGKVGRLMVSKWNKQCPQGHGRSYLWASKDRGGDPHLFDQATHWWCHKRCGWPSGEEILI